jgi:hypothetical protein
MVVNEALVEFSAVNDALQAVSMKHPTSQVAAAMVILGSLGMASICVNMYRSRGI